MHDWIGTERPTEETIAGAQILAWGAMRIKAITEQVAPFSAYPSFGHWGYDFIRQVAEHKLVAKSTDR